MNLGLLIKFMGMTASTNDAEALMFMRKANEMLRNNGTTWEQLLGGHRQSLAPSADDPEPAKPKASLSEQIAFALGYLRPLEMSASFREFVDESQRKFDEDGYLNEFARAQLFGAVRRAQAGRAI